MKYVVSIGSNIKPSYQVPWVIQNMYDAFDEVLVSRFFRTHPYAMASKAQFWNGVVMIESKLGCKALKALLCCWETESGRDRRHPQCSIRDRTLDLDILWHEKSGWCEDVDVLKGLSYMWKPISSLLVLHEPQKKHDVIWFKTCGILLGGRRRRLK